MKLKQKTMENNQANKSFFASLSKEEAKTLMPLLEEEILRENQILFQK